MLKLIYTANIGWFQSLKSLKLKKSETDLTKNYIFLTEIFCHFFNKENLGIYFFPIVNLTKFFVN